MSVTTSRFLMIDGVRTHYLEAGDGPPLLLLHGSEYGASAELAWERLIPLLRPHFRVIAPDLIGFGQSAKVHDFESAYRRRTENLARLLACLTIESCHLVGTSMGGTLLLHDQTAPRPELPACSLTLICSGGKILDNEARQTLLEYDGSVEAMRRFVSITFYSDDWSADDTYVQRRVDSSRVTGAWECKAATRLAAPYASAASEYGGADEMRYEDIHVPVLLIAGAQDPLKEPGYAEAVANRIPSSEVTVLDECGHCANVEHPEKVAELLIDFACRHRMPPARRLLRR